MKSKWAKNKWAMTMLAGLIATPVLADGVIEVESDTSDLYVFPDGGPITGVTVVTRESPHVAANISTGELTPGGAYSVWWVIFNRPQFCSDPCSLDDLPLPGNSPDPRAEASLLWGGGFVADGMGYANIALSLRRNQPPGQVLFGPGLKRLFTAQIHVALRAHGAAVPGLVAEQVSSFGGGCGPAPTFDGCANVYVSRHFVANGD